MYNVIMKRINYHLTDKQIEQLKAISKETGAPVAELIRRAVDAWLHERGRGEVR
jgi:predicted DNA-binding protein